VAEKPDGGSWAVIRYVPSLPTDKVEGEFPAFFDGWFGRQEEALAVAQDWVSQHPEHAVVVIRANRFLGKGSNVQKEGLPSSHTTSISEFFCAVFWDEAQDGDGCRGCSEKKTQSPAKFLNRDAWTRPLTGSGDGQGRSATSSRYHQAERVHNPIRHRMLPVLDLDPVL